MASFDKNTQVASFHLHYMHLYFLVFLVISITKFPLSSHCCHEDDRNSLLSFKSSLDDPSNRLSSWKPGSQHNCCNWHGIKCSHGSFRVVSIDLRNEGLANYIEEFEYDSPDVFDPPSTSLAGKFSASLLKVTHLEYLDLAYNDFQESDVPRKFSDLTSLTHLDLSYTNFSSSIAAQVTNLSSLQFLDLSCNSNYFSTSCLESSSTKWVRGLVNLKVLRLSGIDLHEATSSQEKFGERISYLSNLRELDLSYCNISSPVFPVHELHNLSRLSSFKMNYNSGLHSPFPVELANLTSLSILELSGCNLHGSVPYLDGSLHSSFYNLSKLQYLDLSDNSVAGVIHHSISNLKFLYHLDLSFNNFEGYIPKSICENLPLQILFLDYNNITGTIPSCLSQLKNLRHFSVAGNFIEGYVSFFTLMNENLIALDMRFNSRLNLDMSLHLDQYSLYHPKFRLKYLRLRSCNLKGLFPISVCSLTNLVELDFTQNSLTGSIPSCLFKLKHLIKIHLPDNELHGPVPLPPKGIKQFDLSNNKFSGEISSELGKRLFNAFSISLAGNQLSGSIPFTICPTQPGFTTSTQYIDLSNNKLSGTIPSNIGNCGDLRGLQLSNNNLTGNVPDGLKLAKYISFLQLNNNHLEGTPLHIISKFHELKFLNLANNNFEGNIPNTISSLKYLRFLSLRSNKFNGSIPKAIIHLQELQILDLALNDLHGHIPSELGKLRGLIIINHLQGRNYGDIQLYLATKGNMIHMNRLNDYTSVIDLSCNHLHGNIPKEIGLLTLLSSLNLSHNHFSNDIPESIGNLSGLQSLDLSYNNFSGYIPQSLAIIDTLAILNLSYNKLRGKIPRGSHFDTLSVDGWAFLENELLCGYPTNKICDADRNTSTGGEANPANEFINEDEGEDKKDTLLLYAIVAFGFIAGFWGLFFVLFLKRHQWWFPYWKLVDSVALKIIGCIQNI